MCKYSTFRNRLSSMCLECTLGEGFITELMELPRHSSKGKKQKEIITATITPSKRLMMKNHIPFCFLRPSIQRYDFPVSIFVVDNWQKASTNFKKQIGFNSCLIQDAPSSNGIYFKGSAKHDCLYWPQNKSKLSLASKSHSRFNYFHISLSRSSKPGRSQSCVKWIMNVTRPWTQHSMQALNVKTHMVYHGGLSLPSLSTINGNPFPLKNQLLLGQKFLTAFLYQHQGLGHVICFCPRVIHATLSKL